MPNVCPQNVPPRGPPGWVDAYKRYPNRDATTKTNAVIAQGRCVRSMRMKLWAAGHSAVGGGVQILFEKLVGVHAMRRVVRAGVYATGLGVIAAEVAGGRFLLRDLGALARRSGLRHLERMNRDVAVRAVVGA